MDYWIKGTGKTCSKLTVYLQRKTNSREALRHFLLLEEGMLLLLSKMLAIFFLTG